MSIRPTIIDRKGERPCIEPWLLYNVLEELAKARKPTLWERFMEFWKRFA